jgi:hypothetical protein
MAASWKKVLLEGVNDQKDLVTGAGLTGGENNVLIGTDSDVEIELDINGLPADDGATDVGDLIAVFDISAASGSGAHAKKTQLEVAPIQALTFGPAIRNSSVDAATGNYGIGLDITELTEAALAAKTFIAIATHTGETMTHAHQKKILLEDIPLSEFNNDLSITDKFASAFAFTAGTTAGPTGSLTVTNGSAVPFAAIPSAASGASGIVTTGDQQFAGNKTFDNNVIVTGSLTVNGDLTTIDTDNLTVKDTFISLNNGGASNVDAGIVFEGAADKVFAWDQSEGRFAVSYTGGNAGAAGGGFTRLGDMAVTHNGAGSGITNVTAALAQLGNFFVNSDEEALYVYA